jgi:hypothetical protein
MTPIEHAKAHAIKFGGAAKDYLKIDEFIDQTKMHWANDSRHRAFLHNSLGISLCEQVFGPVITNSEGKEIPVREIARMHIVQDIGHVPTVQDWLNALQDGSYGRYDRPGRVGVNGNRKDAKSPKVSLTLEER